MILFTEKIPQKNFETVRDILGQILFLEIQNQRIVWEIEEEISVYNERTTPISQGEEIVVNVLLNSANYSGMTQKSMQGRTAFFIDIYTSLKADQNGLSGQNSAKYLHKVIGWIIHVLEYSDYKTLGIPMSAGMIGGTSVDDFEILTQNLNQDSSFFKMGRVNFSARIIENTPLEQGDSFSGNDAEVKLDLTDKGYKYEFNN